MTMSVVWVREDMRLKIKIESREPLWKKKTYKTVESGKGWNIERPYKFDLEKGLEQLFKRKEKWE